MVLHVALLAFTYQQAQGSSPLWAEDNHSTETVSEGHCDRCSLSWTRVPSLCGRIGQSAVQFMQVGQKTYRVATGDG